MGTEVHKHINVNPENSYPFPDDGYWHKSCSICSKQFDGPKRVNVCYPCSHIGEQLIFDFAGI